MKKTIIVTLLLSVTLLTGCINKSETNNSIQAEQDPYTKDWTTWNRDGLYFKYPPEIIASYSETGDLVVQKTTISELAKHCYDKWKDQVKERAEDIQDSMIRGLKSLKNEGLTYNNANDINQIETVACGWAGGNIKTLPLEKLSKEKGVIFVKAIGNADTAKYMMQALLITKEEDVYTLTFNPFFNFNKEELDKSSNPEENEEIGKFLRDTSYKSKYPETQKVKSNFVTFGRILTTTKLD